MANPFGTGAIARPVDKRDYQLGYAAAPGTRPATYMPDYSSLPVKMQGTYGTCGGHAGAAMESFLEMLDLSPKFLWKNIKVGTDISQDVGTDMRTIFQKLQAQGTCHEPMCPDTLDGTFALYSDARTLTDAQKNDAYPHGISNYAFIENPTWDQIRAAIVQYKAVIARVECGTGWYTDANGNSSWAKKDVLPLKLGTYESGHFIVLWGYDQNYIYFRNSWSNQWASTTGQGTDGGDGYFDRSYLPHVKEIGTAIDSVSTQQKLVTLYTKLLLVLQQLLGSLQKKNG